MSNKEEPMNDAVPTDPLAEEEPINDAECEKLILNVMEHSSLHHMVKTSLYYQVKEKNVHMRFRETKEEFLGQLGGAKPDETQEWRKAFTEGKDEFGYTVDDLKFLIQEKKHVSIPVRALKKRTKKMVKDNKLVRVGDDRYKMVVESRVGSEVLSRRKKRKRGWMRYQ